MKQRQIQGFIALTSVLILSAIFLSITISLASRAIVRLDDSVAFRERDQARYLTEACIENTLLEIQQTLAYQAGEVILVGDSSCEIIEIREESGETVIQAQSTVGAHTYRMQAAVSLISPDMSISSFGRVTTF